MSHKIVTRLALVLLFAGTPLSVCSGLDGLRTWQSGNGKYHGQARLVSSDGESVVLENGGKQVRVITDLLCQADQQFVAELMTGLRNQQAAFRTWHDASAARYCQAKLIRVKGDQVTLERVDGHRAVVLLTDLSPADQAFIATLAVLNKQRQTYLTALLQTESKSTPESAARDAVSKWMVVIKEPGTSPDFIKDTNDGLVGVDPASVRMESFDEDKKSITYTYKATDKDAVNEEKLKKMILMALNGAQVTGYNAMVKPIVTAGGSDTSSGNAAVLPPEYPIDPIGYDMMHDGMMHPSISDLGSMYMGSSYPGEVYGDMPNEGIVSTGFASYESCGCSLPMQTVDYGVASGEGYGSSMSCGMSDYQPSLVLDSSSHSSYSGCVSTSCISSSSVPCKSFFDGCRPARVGILRRRCCCY